MKFKKNTSTNKMSNYSILLHSKYSENSKKLLGSIDASGTNFYEFTKIQLVCIDNEQVRDRIVNNKEIDIGGVPCILNIFNDGNVEKYEGVDAFKWVEQIIGKLVSEREEKIQQQRINEQLRQQLQQQQMQKQHLEMELQKQMEIAKASQEAVAQKLMKKQPKRKAVAPPPAPITSVEDIETEDENEDEVVIDEDDEDDYKPPVAIRNGKGNYEIGNVGGKIENNRKVSAGDSKRNDLMSMALQMQKSRESQETKIKTVG